MTAFVVESERDTGFVLDVSAGVREHVRDHGDQLFVWLEDVGDGWALEKVSTSPPDGDREFEEIEVDGFRLCLERGHDRREGLRLMLDPWWPFEPFAIPAGAQIAVLRRVPSAAGRFTV